MSESHSVTGSLPRDLEKSNSSKAIRMGVAFDPSAGPSESDQSSKVRNHMTEWQWSGLVFPVKLYVVMKKDLVESTKLPSLTAA